MPPKNKTKNAPNQHDKRHESGLAPPGKRVSKKPSDSQLNGHANGKPVPPGSPAAAPPSTGITHSFRVPRTPDSASPADPNKDHAGLPEGAERDRTYSDASLDDATPGADMADPYQDSAYPSGSGELSSPACKKNAPPHAGSTLSTISTILACYPLRDAISILILLLSLPPTLVLVIQTLFASLTFVPPTAGISLSTLPNIKEIFNSSNFGYPALATILIVDLIFWVCWLPVWKPVQGIFLDLSQAVIAISLSGAAASTGGPTYSIASCSVIVCIVHVLRYKAIHLTALDYLRSVLHKMDIGVNFDVPSIVTNFISSPPLERGWLYTVIRTILGIHIVSQGVTTCIRRSLVKANEQSANVPAITKSDTEATAGAEPRSNNGHAEGAQHSAAASSTDGRPPGPPPVHRENKSRESSSKKKRKQANQVRSQQPLWAAIASTKVTFVKEMEQRDAVDDAREAARMDANTNYTTVNSTQITDRIWICDVRDTEVLFSVELSADSITENGDKVDENMNVSTGIDKSKPFYVRINGAAWSSTRIMMVPGEKDSFNMTGDRYEGEIFGLAPLSSYNVEIVGIASKKILCSASIITLPAPTAEQAATASSQQAHQALRPSSPITTLKQSIQSAESKLNETRNRSKKNKKDQRAVHADIKREINTLKSKLESSGGVDDKQERRLMQINQHKAQAEEAATEIKEQIETLGELPADDVAQSETKRRTWQSAVDEKRSATKDNDNAKAEAERELSTLKSEISQAESKREKLVARHTQKAQELEKLVSKQRADMTAKQRRDLERSQTLQRREEEENQFRYHTATMESEAQNFQQKAHDTYQQIAALQSWSTQPPPYPGYSSPPTPDVIQGTNSALNSPVSNGFPTFGPQPFHSPFHSAQPSISNPGVPRGRSSSMLSQYSGFTDNGEEYSFSPEQPPRMQYTWPLQANAGAAIMDDRKESEGSGSASLNNGSTGSSNNSPRPEAKTFVPGKSGPPVPAGLKAVSFEKTPHSPVRTQPPFGNGPGVIGSGR